MFSKRDLKKIWQQVPPDYYQKGIEKNVFQRIWHGAKLSNLLLQIKKSPKIILDVGCASGWLISEVQKKHPQAKCFGVDVYDRAIRFGEKNYPHVKFVKADAHKMPFKDSSFDLIICTEVLEHVIDPEVVLGEIKRILKPGGVALIEMDSGNLLFRIVWFFWTNVLHGVWENAHLHVFNTRVLRDAIVKSGLRIRDTKVFNFSMAVVFKCAK